MTTPSIHEPPVPSTAASAGISDVLLRNPARRGPVLLAVHGEERSTAPVMLARQLAARLGLELHPLTVVEPIGAYGGGMEIGTVAPLVEQELRAGREKKAREYIRRGLGLDRAFALDVRIGQPTSEIARVAHEIDATLIVVGAAPHRRLRHLVSGQRASQILRRSSCPVVSVAPALTSLPRQVVAAVDFSPASIRAVQSALLVADDYATLTLVHVTPPTDLSRPLEAASGGMVGGSVAGSFERLRDELRAYLPPGVTVETRIEFGAVIDDVLAIGEEVEADLIAVGTRGPNVIEQFFVGSVAADTLHLATSSVIASPPPSAGESVRLKLQMSGTVVTDEPQEWDAMLDAFRRRNCGRRVTAEVDDPAFGAQVRARGYTLQGATYDPINKRVEIMLAATPTGSGHLTRSIEYAESVAIYRDASHTDRALQVWHGHGHTLVLLED